MEKKEGVDENKGTQQELETSDLGKRDEVPGSENPIQINDVKSTSAIVQKSVIDNGIENVSNEIPKTLFNVVDKEGKDNLPKVSNHDAPEEPKDCLDAELQNIEEMTTVNNLCESQDKYNDFSFNDRGDIGGETHKIDDTEQPSINHKLKKDVIIENFTTSFHVNRDKSATPENVPLKLTASATNSPKSLQQSPSKDSDKSTPRSPLSGVATDQGESFDSNFLDTDEENSIEAQKVVDLIINKAVDQVEQDTAHSQTIQETEQKVSDLQKEPKIDDNAAEDLLTEQETEDEVVILQTEQETDQIAANLQTENKKNADDLKIEKLTDQNFSNLQTEQETVQSTADHQTGKVSNQNAANLKTEQETVQNSADLQPKQKTEQSAADLQTEQETVQNAADLQTKQETEQNAADLQTEQKIVQNAADLQTKQETEQNASDLQTEQETVQNAADLQTKQETEQNAADLQTEQETVQSAADLQTGKVTYQNAADLQTKQETEQSATSLQTVQVTEQDPTDRTADAEDIHEQEEIDTKNDNISANQTDENDSNHNIFLSRSQGNVEDSDQDDVITGAAVKTLKLDDVCDGSRVSHPVVRTDVGLFINQSDPPIVVKASSENEQISVSEDPFEGDDENDDDENNFVIDETAHPGYPQVYGTYKACRDVSPGIKECLIFETGEHVKEEKSRSRSNSTPLGSPVKSDTSGSSSVREEKKVFKITKECSSEQAIQIHPGYDTDNNQTLQDQTYSAKENVAEKPLESQKEFQGSDEEQLNSDSQMLTNLHGSTSSLSPVPKTAIHAPSFNIDNYTTVRKDLFTRSSGEEGIENETEHDNKENIPESRLKKKSRNSPAARPPIGRVTNGMEHDRNDNSVEYSRSEVISSPPSSGPIPGFNTMQEQQVSWLRMFKVLEDQHRSELRDQYAKHSHMIEHMQSTMESELRKQQENIQRRLEAHRDALTESTQDESSLYEYYTNDPGNLRRPPPSGRSPKSGRYSRSLRAPFREGYHSDSSDVDPIEVRRRMYSGPVGRLSADISGQADVSNYSTLPSDSFHVKKNLDDEFDTTDASIMDVNRSRRSLQERSRSADGGERLLRGGVYSTPMPMSKGRSPQVMSDIQCLNATFYTGGSNIDISDTLQASTLDADDSYGSKMNLREKHAKHLADLRAYYEQEIQDLRSALSSSQNSKETANEKILKEDNQDLRRRVEELTDELDDSHSHIRELEQSLHGLEVRSADYSSRFKESQLTVLTLKTRLEELHSYAKERDAILDSVEQKMKHQSMALKDSYKIQDELQDSAQRDKQHLQRSASKYEELEKEYRLLKESFINKERSLFDSRAEVADLSKTVTRLELKTKQLVRENESLLHKSPLPVNKTSYEASYAVDSYPSFMASPSPFNDSLQRPDTSVIRHDKSNYSEYLDSTLPEDNPKNTRVSPLIRAEQELLKLQTNSHLANNMDFKSVKKFYGSDNNYPVCGREFATGTRIDIKGPTKTADRSPRPRATWNKNPQASKLSPNSVATKQSTIKGQSKGYLSPTSFDVSVKEVTSGKEKKKVVQIQEKSQIRSPRSPKSPRSPQTSRSRPETIGDEVKRVNGVDSMLDRIKQGEVISDWNRDSCISPSSSKTESLPVQTLTRDERIKERLQMIQKQEKRYDELNVEKRQLESALNRIPIHGRVGRKTSSEKDEMEKKLEKVEHELGSVRMTLRKYQVLKSSR